MSAPPCNSACKTKQSYPSKKAVKKAARVVTAIRGHSVTHYKCHGCAKWFLTTARVTK